MQQRTFNYTKNIPIPSAKLYKKGLVEKVEHVVKRMRWKAFFFYKQDQTGNTEQRRFGFKSKKCPPQVQDMEAFENDLVNMTRNIKFRKIDNTFRRS